jgi:hypothetical protein
MRDRLTNLRTTFAGTIQQLFLVLVITIAAAGPVAADCGPYYAGECLEACDIRFSGYPECNFDSFCFDNGQMCSSYPYFIYDIIDDIFCEYICAIYYDQACVYSC